LIHINHRISWNVIEILQESAIFSNFIQLLMSIFKTKSSQFENLVRWHCRSRKNQAANEYFPANDQYGNWSRRSTFC
jgi:predicted signal transduction protein with EAL and GGDEF domain